MLARAMSALSVTEFTDPGCPFAYSAEPVRWRLLWLYRDRLDWERRMVVLSDSPDEYLEKGFTPERQAESYKRLRAEHGMPIVAQERERMHATAPACRAVVAARLHAPEYEVALLRRLRILTFSGALLDEDATLERAAHESGLDPAELREWMAGDDVAEALAADRAEARSPSPAALVLDWRLAETEEGMRYTCPSYEISTDEGEQIVIPGFRPSEAYEVAIANLAPELDRCRNPSTVEEVLEWAGEPLATVEVAAVAQLDVDDAREQLAESGSFEPMGNDGWWTARRPAGVSEGHDDEFASPPPTA